MKNIDIPNLFNINYEYFLKLLENNKDYSTYQNLARLNFLKNCVLNEWDIANQSQDTRKLKYISRFVIQFEKMRSTIATSTNILEIEKCMHEVLIAAKEPSTIGTEIAAVILGFAGAIVGAITGAILGIANPGLYFAAYTGLIGIPVAFFAPEIYLTMIVGAELTGASVGFFGGAIEGAKAGYDYIKSRAKTSNISSATENFFKSPYSDRLQSSLFAKKPKPPIQEEKSHSEPEQTSVKIA